MERFGEVKLYAPTKHIEIERPTAVSSQHVIALEFPMYVYLPYIEWFAWANHSTSCFSLMYGP
jgi:hypothetical protein